MTRRNARQIKSAARRTRVRHEKRVWSLFVAGQGPGDPFPDEREYAERWEQAYEIYRDRANEAWLNGLRAPAVNRAVEAEAYA